MECDLDKTQIPSSTYKLHTFTSSGDCVCVLQMCLYRCVCVTGAPWRRLLPVHRLQWWECVWRGRVEIRLTLTSLFDHKDSVASSWVCVQLTSCSYFCTHSTWFIILAFLKKPCLSFHTHTLFPFFQWWCFFLHVPSLMRLFLFKYFQLWVFAVGFVEYVFVF